MHPGIVFMRLIAPLPLPVIRALGWCLGHLLYRLARSRRRVTLTNLSLCFPQWSAAQREHCARSHFVVFCQAWLDRSWLWHGREATVRQRLQLEGSFLSLRAAQPQVLFAPHFVGLDAGWAALNLHFDRPFATIYMRQYKPALDAWLESGRQRFGAPMQFPRTEGVRQIARALGDGAALYLLPDLDYGPLVSEFVPYFGVPTATTTSLSRFARVARASVQTVTTRLTPQGYTVSVSEAWPDFPTADAVVDTARMNRLLEGLIGDNVTQYLWTHRRFKTRPAGQASVYA